MRPAFFVHLSCSILGPDQFIRQLPKALRQARIARTSLLADLAHRELLPVRLLSVLRAARGAVVVQAALLPHLLAERHVLQTPASVRDALPDLEEVRRGDVEHLGEQLVLIPKQSGADDQAGRERVDLDVRPARFQPPLELSRKDNVTLDDIVSVIGSRR